MLNSNDKFSRIWQRGFFLTDYLRDITLEMKNSGVLKQMFKDMTFRQMKAFRAVVHLTEDNPEGISLKEISEKLGISPASASEMIDVLVQKEVLARAKDQYDRRAIRIRVSDKMKEELKKIDAFYAEKTRDMMTVLSEQEVASLLEIFDKLYGHVQDKDQAK